VNLQFGSKATLVAVLVLGIVVVLIVVGREIHRALNPRSKPMRKRKRRDF
jgi:hypothetical protein